MVSVDASELAAAHRQKLCNRSASMLIVTMVVSTFPVIPFRLAAFRLTASSLAAVRPYSRCPFGRIPLSRISLILDYLTCVIVVLTCNTQFLYSIIII